MSDTPDRLWAALADRYRIERELGAGGMATVYLAEDLRHGRKVAIKVLRPELAAVIGAERFLREIKTIATLQHPHILGLIDSGEVNGTGHSRAHLSRGGRQGLRRMSGDVGAGRGEGGHHGRAQLGRRSQGAAVLSLNTQLQVVSEALASLQIGGRL